MPSGGGKVGRPTSYTIELSEFICEEIAEGKSLRSICADDGLPNIVTIMRWLSNDEDFANRYARAREIQADVMDAKILDVADACTSETATADRVKIDAYKWRASKLKPKRYGDKLELSGDADAPLNMSLAVHFVRADKAS